MQGTCFIILQQKGDTKRDEGKIATKEDKNDQHQWEKFRFAGTLHVTKSKLMRCPPIHSCNPTLLFHKKNLFCEKCSHLMQFDNAIRHQEISNFRTLPQDLGRLRQFQTARLKVQLGSFDTVQSVTFGKKSVFSSVSRDYIFKLNACSIWRIRKTKIN